jgi:hypothetical protein
MSDNRQMSVVIGHGPQREARYQDELVDCPSAARRTPTPPEAVSSGSVSSNTIELNK